MENVGKLEVNSNVLVPPHVEAMGTLLHGCVPVGGELCYEGMLLGQVKTVRFLQASSSELDFK